MGISLGNPLPVAAGGADQALSVVGFVVTHSTPPPLGTRGMGFLLPSSSVLSDLGCRRVPSGLPTGVTGDVFFSLIRQFTYFPVFFFELLCRATS